MTWVKETPLTWLQRLAVKFVTTGPLPQHVGFIMDGNRRWARKRNVEKVKGHVEGYVYKDEKKKHEVFLFSRLLIECTSPEYEKSAKTSLYLTRFDRLSDVLNWCREIGIREVSVYAFSIENFKRSVEEVEALMKLACEKAEMALKEKYANPYFGSSFRNPRRP